MDPEVEKSLNDKAESSSTNQTGSEEELKDLVDMTDMRREFNARFKPEEPEKEREESGEKVEKDHELAENADEDADESDAEESSKKDAFYADELRQGRIPEDLAEEFRLVPLNDEVAVRFQDEMSRLSKLVAPPERNLEQDPPKFFLSGYEKPNAMCIRPSRPTLFGFNVGLFDVENPAAPKTLDARLGILIHEGAHEFFGREFEKERSTVGKQGVLGDTKLEEIAADRVALQVLYERGFDPRAYYEHMKEVSRLSPTPPPENLPKFVSRILDSHPVNETRLSALEAKLTELEREIGGFKVVPTPLAQDDALTVLVMSAKHLSYLDAWGEKVGYRECSLDEKLLYLKDLLAHVNEWNFARQQDIGKLISELVVDERSLSETEQRVFADFVNTILDGIALLAANKGEDLHGFHRDDRRKEFLRLDSVWKGYYETVCKKVLGASELVPLGRLAEIEALAKSVIDFLTPLRLRDTLAEFLARIDAEPLMQHWYSRTFVRELKWPFFALPRQIGELVLWNGHLTAAITDAKRGDNSLLRGLLELGVEDPRLYKHINDELALSIFSRSPVAGYGSPDGLGARTWGFFGISEGEKLPLPFDGKWYQGRAKLSIHEMEIDSNGRLSQLPSDWESWTKLSGTNQRQAYLPLCREDLIRQVFAMKDDALRLREIKTELGYHRNYTVQDSSLVCLEKFLEDPKKFGDFNRRCLNTNAAAQETLAQEFEKLLKTAGDDATLSKVKKAIRCFFTYGTFNLIDPKERYGDFYAKTKPTGALFRFMMEERWGIFEVREKLERFFEITHHVLGKKELNEYEPFTHSLFPKELLIQITSWRDLIEVTKGAKDHFKELGIFDQRKGTAFHMHQDTEALSTFVEMRAGESEKLPTPTFTEICELLEISPFPHTLYFDGTKGVDDVFMETLEKGREWSEDIKKAFDQWCVVSKAYQMLEPLTAFEDLGELLKRLDASSISDSKKIELLEKVINRKRISNPTVRAKLREDWVHAIKGIYGTDTSEPEYSSKILEVLQRVRDFVGNIGSKETLSLLSNELETQAGLSNEIEKYLNSFSASSFERLGAIGVFGDLALSLVRQRPDEKRQILDLLMNPLTTESITHFVEKSESFTGIADLDKLSSASQRQFQKEKEAVAWSFYSNFWTAPIELRVVMVRELLLPSGVSKDEEKNAFDYVLTKVAPGKDSLSECLRKFVEVYLTVVPEYQKAYLLSSLMAASEPSDNMDRGLGYAIAIVGAAMGPGENKCVQAAHSHPNTKEDIRKDLKQSKIHASEPTRWELMKMIEREVPTDVRDRIFRVGRILGSASFFVTVEIEMVDGTQQALQLLRRNAGERAEEGLRLIQLTAEKLFEEDPRFSILLDFVREAKLAWLQEIDPELGRKKLEIGHAIYHGLVVVADNETFSFDAPKLYELNSKRLAYGSGYRIISKMKGAHFSDLYEYAVEQDRARLRKQAKAIVSAELCNMLSGRPFDDDGHGGNVLIDGYPINRVDFGGFSLAGTSDHELRELGLFLGDLLRQDVGLDNLSERYFSRLRELREAKGEVPSILRKVQKSLLTFSEYERLFNGTDRQDVFLAGILALHPTVEHAMRERIGFKFTLLKGALKALHRSIQVIPPHSAHPLTNRHHGTI